MIFLLQSLGSLVVILLLVLEVPTFRCIAIKALVMIIFNMMYWIASSYMIMMTQSHVMIGLIVPNCRAGREGVGCRMSPHRFIYLLIYSSFPKYLLENVITEAHLFPNVFIISKCLLRYVTTLVHLYLNLFIMFKHLLQNGVIYFPNVRNISKYLIHRGSFIYDCTNLLNDD